MFLFWYVLDDLHHLHVMGGPHGHGEGGQGPGLVHGRQTHGDIQQQGGDTKTNLDIIN